MVYEINGNVVFGKAFTVPSYPEPIIKDIFGDNVSKFDAIDEADRNKNRDSTISSTCCQLTRNAELGKLILIKFREYVYRRNAELGISGNGVELLQSFYLIECGLLAGMLDECSSMILAMPTNEVLTIEIKEKFAKACKSADHIKELV